MESRLRRLFMCASSVALAVALLTVGLVIAQEGRNPTRITTASANNRDSFNPSLSADGTIIAFESNSDFLDQGLSRTTTEIWLYNTATLTFTRITSASERTSLNPNLSADGTVVAFESDADLLGQGLVTNTFEIWLYDTKTMTFTRVTSASTSDRDSRDPSLSGDGMVIAFESNSDLLNQGLLSPTTEIWVYDTKTMTFTRVTSASASDRDSLNPSLNADGTLVAFEGDSDLRREGIQNDVFEIWLYNLATQILTRVTQASADARDSFNPSLSADGTAVVFESDSRIVPGPIVNNQFEIWLYKIPTLAFTRITTTTDQNTRDSFNPTVNDDGTKVAFESDAAFLNQTIQDDQFEIWWYDIGGALARVTRSTGNGRNSFSADLNADGTLVAFESDSDLLADGDIEVEQFEVWLSQIHSVYLPVLLKDEPKEVP